MHHILCKYLAELSLSTTSDPQVIALRIAWAREHLVKKEDDGAFAQAVLDYYSSHPGLLKMDLPLCSYPKDNSNPSIPSGGD